MSAGDDIRPKTSLWEGARERTLVCARGVLELLRSGNPQPNGPMNKPYRAGTCQEKRGLNLI